jgi:hypothetical protein
MTRQRSAPVLPVLVLLLATAAPAAAQQTAIPTPEEHFGFQMGAVGQLADWDQLASYYRRVAELSPRVLVREMGPSTLGNPFLVLFVSSPENLARLDEIRTLNAMLTDPRGASEAEIERAVERGRAIVAQSYGLHSTEVAGAQTPAELVYAMAIRDDREMRRILDETVSILFPSLNPDGTTMVAEWVRRTGGTEFEGSRLPWLYHHYIGHNNNRDAFQQNTVESVWTAQLLFRDWVPQAFIDHHQMGSYGPRLYVPPYAEPIRPDGDPLVWREMAWYGGHIAYATESAGLSGVAGASIFSGWGHFGFHWITPFHNIAGMLTESASARMAWPLYVHPDQLQGSPGRGLPTYDAQVTFPNPWPGGWWTLRDIVEQQLIASIAALDLAARNRETVLRNHYLKASRQVERGLRAEPVSNGPSGPLAAFIIPAEQHDYLTAVELIEKLLLQGVEVRRATGDFTHEGRVYPAGSWVVPMAQPKRGLVRWLLGRTYYPDNEYTRHRDGTPIRPYDLATHNMSEFMGVAVEPVATPVEAATTRVVPDFTVVVRDRIPYVTSGIEPAGEAARGVHGYRLDGRQNVAYHAVNLLLDQRVPVRRAPGGDFLVPANADEGRVRAVAFAAGVEFRPLNEEVGDARPVTRQRIGMYRRYYGGNMDEGQTRLVLERFGFPYERLTDERIRRGRLERDFDVIILPDDSPAMMKGPGAGQAASGLRRMAEDFPPEYRSGFGSEGAAALKAFVQAGGTLITFGQAGDLAIEELDLPVRNVLAGRSPNQFWSPGSTLRVNVDTGHPLGYGMPARALALYVGGSQAYEVVPHDRNERVERVITFPRTDGRADRNQVLESGWLLGEEVLSEKAAMVSVEHGQGRVVLIGFRPQHRAQTWGTYKLVFNGLLGGSR